MESTIKQRIRYILEYNNETLNSISQKIDIPQKTLNNQINQGTDVSIKTALAICGYFENVSIEWLLTGDGEMHKSNTVTSITKIHNPKSIEKVKEIATIPLYDIEAAANLKTLLANKSNIVLGNLSIPNMPKCDGAVYVTGDSMYPLLKSGDIVAYKGIELNVMNIYYGEMYIVSIDMDGDEYLSVKYVQASEKGEDWIKLVSYNKNHQPKDFPLSAIRAMALVKFSVRMNTMR